MIKILELIEILGETTGQFQLEDSLPTSLKYVVYLSKRHEWHRVVKGDWQISVKNTFRLDS